MEPGLQTHIEHKIITIRDVQVMLDSDLAVLYQTETKFINRAVKRNPNRFPEGFVFELTNEEYQNLKFQSGTSSSTHGGRRTNPIAFTEQGVAMLSAVLQTDIAISVSIQIMKAFMLMRKFILQNATVFKRLDQLELKQLQTDQKIEKVFQALESGQPKPDKGIFFDGQIFDAYAFIADLIKTANEEIILIDNFIDETVLTFLSKRKDSVNAIIFTKNISKQLQLDLEKHNAQYKPITIKTFAQSHDRFLLIDRKTLYHIGASLKDLGKKWFAFSRMDSMVEMISMNLKSAITQKSPYSTP